MAKLQIYTTPTCPWCKKTKDFLKKSKIPYTERNALNPKYQKEMIKKSGQTGVPVLDINGQIIVGYDPSAIKKALKKPSVKKTKTSPPKKKRPKKKSFFGWRT